MSGANASPSRVVFVDRDGVVNALAPDPRTGLPEGPLRLDEVRLLPGAAQALIELRRHGFLLACVTNQPGAAKQLVSRDEIEAIHARVMALLAEEGARFDATAMCLHHPDGPDPLLGVVCGCRKPAPGMLLELAARLGGALRRSWMVGDVDTDVEAALSAGCRAVLVENPESAHKREPGRFGGDIPRTADLTTAATVIIAEEAG